MKNQTNIKATTFVSFYLHVKQNILFILVNLKVLTHSFDCIHLRSGLLVHFVVTKHYESTRVVFFVDKKVIFLYSCYIFYIHFRRLNRMLSMKLCSPTSKGHCEKLSLRIRIKE